MGASERRTRRTDNPGVLGVGRGVRAALRTVRKKYAPHCFRPMILPPKSNFRGKEADMESIISHLVARFEKGSLSRRDLVQGLALLAASGTAAAAQEDVDFKGADIDHISIHVADLQRSVDFYQKTFGFSVVSQDQPRSIIRLGAPKMRVSLNHGSPAGIVDHFAIGITRFNKESVVRHLKQRGATPLEGDYAGLHVKDPDGINVQIVAQGGTAG